MKTIVYTCPYVPAEWIAAHGLQPRRLIPRPVEGVSTIPRIEGLCPYARAFANDVAASKDVDGVIVTTMCDQMRRVFDLLVRRINVPTFLLNVPSTWQTVAVQRLYLDELKRLGRFLVRLGGQEPDKQELVRVMLRQRVFEPWHEHPGCEALWHRHPADDSWAGSPCHAGGSVPLAIVGGPLMQRDHILFDIVEECGGQIVLDATETGQRGQPEAFDRRRLVEDPLMELAQAYFHLPDPSRRPNSGLYEWLRDNLARNGARGLVLHHYLWCDKWHAEFERIKEWIKLPLLRLDGEGQGQMDSLRVRNRVRAFVETLR